MKYLTPDECTHLRDVCARSLTARPRDTVMLLLTLDLGLRSQELLNLTFRDIDLISATVKIKTLKRGIHRELPAPTYLLEYVRAHESRIDSERVFAISRQRLFQIWDEMRPVKIKFHALRHTFARSLYNKTADIRMVQQTLGHKSLASTTVYLEVNYDQETLRKAFGFRKGRVK